MFFLSHYWILHLYLKQMPPEVSENAVVDIKSVIVWRRHDTQRINLSAYSRKSLKLVDYLHLQADNPWYNCYMFSVVVEL